jgi:hypothetical protein
VYVFDTNVFITLGNYYPSRFPTIWQRIGELVGSGGIISTREVCHELDNACGEDHIHLWIEDHKDIFTIPTNEECEIVRQIFHDKQNLGLVKLKSIKKGIPVADPFVIALAKIKKYAVVTQETYNRMPSVCQKIGVECINLEEFLKRENLRF